MKEYLGFKYMPPTLHTLAPLISFCTCGFLLTNPPGSLEAVCKCISGFTDTFYKANKEFYAEGSDHVLASKPNYVDYVGGNPDVWFEPQEVWELAFADITISPTYKAAVGLVSEDKGLSLRFPRFLKKREDKGVDEASTGEFLAGLWRKQEERGPGPGAGAKEGKEEYEEGVEKTN